MVAISLYRGNLHRVPDIPRRWQMPPQSFTTAVFKKLISRRSKALTRLLAIPPVHSTPVVEEEDSESRGGEKPNCASVKLEDGIAGAVAGTAQGSEKAEERRGDCGVEAKGNDEASACPPHSITQASKDLNGSVEVKIEGSSPVMEARKKEVENKLNDLKDKKHHLVQMLKMIIGAEEEIMRRTTMQASAARVSTPVRAEATFDAAARPVIPKLSVDVNFGGASGGESECISNPSTQMRHRHNIPSTSPSLGSPNPFSRTLHASFQHNSVLRTPRGSSISSGNAQTASNSTGGNVSSSPSGQCASTNQTHLGLPLPHASVSGTHYVAAAMQSPAGLRGASVFKDPRLTSP